MDGLGAALGFAVEGRFTRGAGGRAKGPRGEGVSPRGGPRLSPDRPPGFLGGWDIRLRIAVDLAIIQPSHRWLAR
ncbi:hypothetical protein NOVOSPHI9U_40421 [Novosphingobium sp. 9U]|nr:hypothetical protein NOVOSPHI9U_40421 [Novosphingobium sp. 9U]